MDSEDSNFPSATKDRKPSELNYPCLTSTRQEHTLQPTHRGIFTHTHTNPVRTLSHSDMQEITQSNPCKQTERSVSPSWMLFDEEELG